MTDAHDPRLKAERDAVREAIFNIGAGIDDLAGVAEYRKQEAELRQEVKA